MKKIQTAIALTFALAAAAGSAIAAEGDLNDTSAAAQGTIPAYEQARDQTPRVVISEQRELQANHGEIGRGQGSGVMMSNRGEMAAQRHDAMREGKPLQNERGETASGQGSGPAVDQQDMRGQGSMPQSTPR